jgi:hypothetical protein
VADAKAAGRLDRVRDRVPEVEDRPAAGLALVAGDDLRLPRHARGDRSLEGARAPAPQVPRVRIQPREEPPVRGGGDLHDLREPGGHLRGRKSREHGDVRVDARGLVEGPHEVLRGGEIHAGLPPDRGVHHGEERRRNLDHGHAAVPRRREEAREVARHAAAERDEHGVPAHPEREQPVLEPRLHLARLAVLSRGERQEARPEPGRAQAQDESASVESRHGRVRDDDEVAGREALREVPGEEPEDAPAHAHHAARARCRSRSDDEGTDQLGPPPDGGMRSRSER